MSYDNSSSRELVVFETTQRSHEDPLEYVEAQGSNDASAVAMVNKDGGTMKSSSQENIQESC